MKKEIIIVSIIVILTIIFNIITQNYTNKMVNLFANKLDDISKLANEEFENNSTSKEEEISNRAESLTDEWAKKSSFLAFYIEHDELEKVDTSIVTLKEYLKIGKYEEAIPELKKCEFLLNHIKEKETLKTINLF